MFASPPAAGHSSKRSFACVWLAIMAAAIVCSAQGALAGAGGSSGGARDSLVLVIEYDEHDLRLAFEDGYHRANVQDMRLDDSPRHIGRPEIPIEEAQFIIPPRMQVTSVHVRELEVVEVEGEVLLRPVQPRSDPADDVAFVPPDSTIYNQATPYPGFLAELKTQGAMRGYELATCDLLPVQYVPRSRSLLMHTRIEVILRLEPMSHEVAADRVVRAPQRPAHSLRGTEIQWLRRNVRNPDDLDRYYAQALTHEVESTPFGGFEPTEFPSVEGPAVQMVIITNEQSAEGADLGDMVGEFQVLADWKTQKGVPTVVRTMDWIRSHFIGPDDPAKIREFIKESYVKWGTDWVLLGGDIDVVPGRRIHDYPIATSDVNVMDSYYAGLDGDWDLDNNGKYGESGEFDPALEVWIGRAPVHTASEAEVVVGKSLTYARAPGGSVAGLDENYYTRYIGFCTERGRPRWITTNPTYWSETIAQRILPAGFDKLRMYRNYGTPADTFCVNYFTWHNIVNLPNKHAYLTDTLKTYFSGDLQAGGFGYAFHSEHSNVYTEGGPSTAHTDNECPPHQVCCGSLGREDVDDLGNGTNLTIVFSRGSHVNGIEYGSVSERWLLNPDGGAVAYFGMSRSPGWNEAKIDTTFFENIFPTPFGTAIETLGQVAALTDPTGYFVLLGDPELAPWTDRPDTLSVTVSPSTFPGPGVHSFVVAVRDHDNAAGVPSALVCLQQGNRAYSYALTDGSGFATLRLSLPTADALQVTATARSYVPSVSTVSTGMITVPNIVYHEHTVVEEPGGLSNGNGVVDAGEHERLSVRVKNTGANVTGVTGKMRVLGEANYRVLVDNVTDNSKVYVGSRSANPPLSEVAFSFADLEFRGVSSSGRPGAYDSTTSHGLFVWREGNLWNVIARGRHQVGGDVRFSGWVTTRGGFSDTTRSIDGGDTVHFASADSIYFDLDADNGTPAEQDKFSFVAKEVNWVTVTDSTGTFGSLNTNATAQDTFKVHLRNLIVDRHEVLLEVAAKDGNSNSIGAGLFVLPVAAPVLSYVRQRPEHDLTLPYECTGTCLTLQGWVRNSGSGVADSVRAAMAKTAGNGTVTDSLIFYDTIAGLSDTTLTDYFKVETPDTTNIRLQVNVRNHFPDGSVRVWTKSDIDVRRPCKPTSVTVDGTRHNSLRVHWGLPNGACSGDLAGFNVYRKLSGAADATYALAVGAPFDSTRLHQGVGLVGDTTYVFAVASQDVSGNESEFAVAAGERVWAAVKAGWPKWLDAGTPSSPVAVQLDGEGSLEIIATGNRVYAWHADGTPFLGSNPDGLFFAPADFPLDVPSAGRFFSSPAVGDLDNDGNIEVVVSTFNDSLYVINDDGTRKWAAFLNGRYSSPALGDVDGNDSGKLEVVACGGSGIYVFNHDGSAMSGSPWATLPDGALNNYGSPSLAKIDNNAANVEVVMSTSKGRVYAWRWDSGPSDLMFSFVPSDSVQRQSSTVAIGDLDDNGDLEGVVARCSQGDATTSRVDVIPLLDNGGGPVNPERTWHAVDLRGAVGDDNGYAHPPALADLVGDEDLEILIGTSYSHSNFPFSPLATRAMVLQHGTPSVVDSCLGELPFDFVPPVPDINRTSSQVLVSAIDEVSGLDIIGGSNHGGLHFWESDCDERSGSPTLLYGDVDSTPFIADIDLNDNGRLEMVVKDMGGQVAVLELKGTGPIPWGQFAHDLHHTSWVEGAALQPEADPSGEGLVLRSVYPNPFNPSATIEYVLTAASNVRLEVFDVGGRLVRGLVDAAQDAGSYSVNWDGRNVQDRAVASGQYFVRLETPQTVLVQKILLVR